MHSLACRCSHNLGTMRPSECMGGIEQIKEANIAQDIFRTGQWQSLLLSVHSGTRTSIAQAALDFVAIFTFVNDTDPRACQA